VLVGALATSLVAAAPAVSASPYDPRPTADGAGWLSHQVTHGLVHNQQYDFDDYGLSIDVAFGLRAAHRKPKLVRAITHAIAANVDSYTTAGPTTTYAGATAKALLLAVEQGKNPRSFGGVDLESRLESRVSSAAPITGRIEDSFDPADPFGGDYANVIGQAYAAAGLNLAKSAKAGVVTRFLLRQQCKAGFFRLSFTADKTDPDQTCDGAAKAERAPDTDATAIAALALQQVKGSNRAFHAMIRARDWLVDHQHADGSFGGGTSTEAANANSTGLAGWLFLSTNRTKQAVRAATWLRTLQVSRANPCLRGLKGETGAIAYDVSAYETGLTKGITVKTSDQWRRASAQALPALASLPRPEGSLTVSAPRRVTAGSSFDVRLTGVGLGQRACVVGGAGAPTEYVPGRRPLSRLVVQAPASHGLHTFAVYVGDERRAVTVRVTG
jgi:hypothetical protein